MKALLRSLSVLWSLLLVAGLTASAQSGYQVVSVIEGGTITGAVTWSGPQPAGLDVPINKDSEICDPQSHKTTNLERLVVGPGGGVANTVVFLKNISAGKPMNLSPARRSLDQKQCRYEPHILLVPQSDSLSMRSSDHVLHTVHMEGAASFNVAFPFTDRLISREMDSPGLVTLQCNGGHTWMNAEMMVVSHPYYAVSDLEGKFTLTDVPPGEYRVVAWHEGWRVLGKKSTLDVFSQQSIQRALFSEPRTWEQTVKVHPKETVNINFTLSQK
jgi:hypothetical protein